MPKSLTAALLILAVTSSSAAQATEFALQDDDRVVLLGDALIEQEQYFGWVELMLSTAYPDADVTFRNLGWSGDTPAGASRFGLSLLQAGREPDDEGWKQLEKQLELTKPTVLIVGYGMASALEGGEEGLVAFVREYQRLINTAKRIEPSVRLVFLTPLTPLGGDELPLQPTATYANAVSELATLNNGSLVDLQTVALEESHRKDPIHLNELGYRAVAESIETQLDLPTSAWQTSPHAAALRETILRKNQWWFNRSRPANMAYVFGFRKHEQGQNAVEIPQFDKLIADEETLIAAQRKLQPTQEKRPEPRLASQFAKFTEQPIPEFTVDSELEITLWAQNPDLNKPIHMNFDPQGRLWVASSEAYPMIEVGQSPPDKVIVLEDTNGDGTADKSTVFADGLLIPTGIAPGNGGVYVAQSTDLLFLKDTDGDGKADERRRVLSGFGTEDTHHNLHTLRWGLDGRLYMNQSVYTRTDMETPYGVVRLKAGGGFRYDTETMWTEIFFRGLWNSWGHQFDAFGQSFLSDGAGFAGIAYSFPGATFRPTPNAREELGLISPGNWPKFASLEIIASDSFPPEWQGSIITCDFRANRVTRFSLTEQGAGFVTKQEPDLVRTSAATFRPIDVKLGPDGALYIADWSNPIINHGEVDFRDSRRDRWHGRIWRVAWKDRSPKRTGDLSQEPTSELLNKLTSADRYVVDQARRVLIERGDESRMAVTSWLAAQDTNTARLQGLWLFQALKLDTASLVQELVRSDDARIRAAATRVLGQEASGELPDELRKIGLSNSECLALLRELTKDPHPRVRLEAICALTTHRGSEEAAQAVFTALEQPMDRFIEHALGLAITELAPQLIDAIEKDDDSLSDLQVEFVLTRVEPTLASRFLAERLKSHPITRDGVGPWIELIGSSGGVPELDTLFDQVTADSFDQAATDRALTTLFDAQRLRRLRPSRDLGRLGKLMHSTTPSTQFAAIRLAGVWKQAKLNDDLIELARSQDTPEPSRLESVIALRTVSGERGTSALESISMNDESLSVRAAAIQGLAARKPDQAIDSLLTNLQQIESEQAALEMWRTLLQSKGFGERIAGKIEDRELPEAAIMAGLRAAKDGGRQEPQLLAALEKLSGSKPKQEMTVEDMQAITALVGSGNPSNGERIYRRAELACTNCHAIGGVGGKVGPDMTSLGASAPVDYLVESIYKPNAKIKEGYHSVIVATEDDQILTGIEVSSSDEELVLRDADNKLTRIPQADILGKRAGQSLMPVGVVDRLSQQEQVDLLCFLSNLGKPGKYDASQGGVARVYEVFAGTHRREQIGADKILSGEMEGWQPVTALVSGDLPKELLIELTKQPINIALVHVYLKTRIQASNPIEAEMNVPEGAKVWLDGQPLEGEGAFSAKLTPGTHELILRLDARELPEVVRVESDNVTFVNEHSAAQ